MSKSSEAQINEEIYMGVVPALKEDRIYNSNAITIAAAGFGVASWCYVQGGWIASILPFPLAIIVSIIPMIIFGLVMMLCVIIPTRYGIDLWIYQKAVFGYNLCTIICLVAILTNWGWYAINCNVFASASSSLLKLVGFQVPSGAAPWLGSICAIVGFLLAMNGPHVVKYSTYIIVPCLLGVGVVLLVKTLSVTDIGTLVNSTPMYLDTYSSTKVGFLCMVEAMFGFIFAWYPVLGSMSRITKTERSSYWGQTLGYVVAMAFFVVIGVVSSTLMGNMGVYSTDPTDLLMTLSNPVWSGLSVLAIALANITTQTLGCYCLSLATKIFKPTWNYKILAGGYTLFVVALIFWQGIWNYYNVFLAATAVIGAPACAIILIDYFVIRKEKVSLQSLYKLKGNNAYEYTYGFNIPALISFLVAIFTYISIYDPLNYVVKNERLMVFTPSVLSFVIAALSYFLICTIPAVKVYILKDRTEIKTKEMEKENVTEGVSGQSAYNE